jgi:hypothetical protein
MSVVVILEGIFFPRAATFKAILGTRGGYRALDRRLEEVVGERTNSSPEKD